MRAVDDDLSDSGHHIIRDLTIPIERDLLRAAINEANIHYKKQEWTEAIQCFTRALALNPPHAKDLIVQRGTCHLKLAKTDKAIEDADLVLNMEHTNYKALALKADALFLAGGFEFALMYYHRGNKLRQDMPEFRLGIQNCQIAIANSIDQAEIDASLGINVKRPPKAFAPRCAQTRPYSAGGGPRSSSASRPLSSSSSHAFPTSTVTLTLSESTQSATPVPPINLTALGHSSDLTAASTIGGHHHPRPSSATPIRPSSATTQRVSSRLSSITARPNTSIGIASTTPIKPEKAFLGKLYEDKMFLKELADDKLMGRSIVGGANGLKHLITDGLQFLNTRQEFWRQQDPGLSESTTTAPHRTAAWGSVTATPGIAVSAPSTKRSMSVDPASSRSTPSARMPHPSQSPAPPLPLPSSTTGKIKKPTTLPTATASRPPSSSKLKKPKEKEKVPSSPSPPPHHLPPSPPPPLDPEMIRQTSFGPLVHSPGSPEGQDLIDDGDDIIEGLPALESRETNSQIALSPVPSSPPVLPLDSMQWGSVGSTKSIPIAVQSSTNRRSRALPPAPKTKPPKGGETRGKPTSAATKPKPKEKDVSPRRLAAHLASGGLDGVTGGHVIATEYHRISGVNDTQRAVEALQEVSSALRERRFDEALINAQSLLDALSSWEVEDKPRFLANTFSLTGTCYFELGRLDLAVVNHKKDLETGLHHDYLDCYVRALHNLAITYERLKEWPNAVAMWEKKLAHTQDPTEMALIWEKIGQDHLNDKNYHSAVHFLNQVLNSVTTTNPRHKMSVMRMVGRAMVGIGGTHHVERAISMFEGCVEIAKEINDPDAEMEALGELNEARAAKKANI